MSTVNGRVNREFTPAPGNKNTGKFWNGGFGMDKMAGKNTGPFRKKDPGIHETRNDRKAKDCPFCG